MKNDSQQLKNKPASAKAVPWLKRMAPVLDRIGYIIVVTTVAIVACLLLMMFWILPNRPVARITLQNGTVTKITTHAFQERLAIERTRNINLQKEQAAKAKIHPAEFEPDYRYLATLGFAAGVIDRLTHEVLIQEEASRRGLTVSDDEIDLVIARTYGLVVWPKETPAPSNPSAAAWLEARPELREEVKKTRAEAQLRLKKDELPKDYRRIVRLEILEEKLKAAFFADIPVEQDRVRLKSIRFETETDALKAAAGLRQGELFDALYDRVIQGVVSSATGLILDWSSRAELDRDYNAQFGQTVMDLHVGDAVSQPIAAAHGWYLVKVENREMRNMAEDWRRQRGLDAMQTWFAQQNTRVVQYPEWMERVPPTPPIPNREYAGELPLPGGGAGPAGKPLIPGMPGALGGKESAGSKNPMAGHSGHDSMSKGGLNGSAGPSRQATSPGSLFDQLQNPAVPGRPAGSESIGPPTPGSRQGTNDPTGLNATGPR